MKPTAEQQQVIDDVLHGQHVSVTALPGSGKSRVAYELLRQCTDTHVVLIMYNRSLCDATTEHIQRLGLDPARTIRAFTFHSLVSSITQSACHNDCHLNDVICNDTIANTTVSWYLDVMTLLIVDEAQDIRPLFIRLLHQLIRRCTQRARLRVVFLGDPRQLLYGFYNHGRADKRFLTLAPLLLRDINARTWTERCLTCSFRSTPQVTNVLNAMVPLHHMVSGKVAGPPVTFHICNVRSLEPASMIVQLLSTYQPADVLILCSTLGPTSAARAVVRTLVQHRIPVHVQRSGRLRNDDTDLHSSMSGRVQVKTFCAAKGLEAKLVVVINDRNLVYQMENSVYVALSRSTHQLVVFQDRSGVSMEELRSFCPTLGRSDLSVFTQSKSPCHLVRPVQSLDRRPQTHFRSEMMFDYVNPACLAQLREYVQCVATEHVFAESAEAFVRVLHVPTVSGHTVYVRTILTSAILLAVEYQRTHRLPARVYALARCADPVVNDLFVTAMSIVDMRLFFVADAWDVRHLFLKLPAFAMLATALDALASFEENLSLLDDFGFMLYPCVVDRVRWLLDQLQLHMVDTTRPVYPFQTRVFGETTLHGDPFLVSAFCVIGVINKPSSEPEDHLTLALDLVIADVEYGYLCNLHTGVVTQVYMAQAQHCAFARDVLSLRATTENELDDPAFLETYRFVN